uniref:protein acetyllysine N-acetyltransferase n=1 Tax=Culicoides sonorensis TaxID=179676 RepID=A0A336K0Y7_CULSO
MSCNYAEGLSDYDNKGVLGIQERFDTEDEIHIKCRQLADLILNAKKVVVHTGAGISTSAGIPDFRGPNGVWTLEKKGEKPKMDISFNDAVPTKTHMALKSLIKARYIHYIVSQNIDGLHLKSGIERKYISELHGNYFLEQCQKCKRQFIRPTQAPTVGKKATGNICPGSKTSRACRGGNLIDNILDWEHDLPDKDLDLAYWNSTLADLNITLGTTLQIVPAGSLPFRNKKYGGKTVICNLQPTKHDKKADLIISTYVDAILEKVCKFLGVEIEEYSIKDDPTKQIPCDMEWTIPYQSVKDMEKEYDSKIKILNKKRKGLLVESSKNESEKIFKKKKKEDK